MCVVPKRRPHSSLGSPLATRRRRPTSMIAARRSSPKRSKRKPDAGSPCFTLRMNLVSLVKTPLTSTRKEAPVYSSLTMLMNTLPKPSLAMVAHRAKRSVLSKAFSISRSKSSPSGKPDLGSAMRVAAARVTSMVSKMERSGM